MRINDAADATLFHARDTRTVYSRYSEIPPFIS